jgi:uncharacterized protein with NRDE domain
MCLILFAHRLHPNFPLVLAANRDEFFARPTDAARFWPEHSHVLAGRDLEKGGTWMGVARDGRWSAVTNFRDGTRPDADSRSRGELVAGYLCHAAPGADYVAGIISRQQSYHGFNLLVGDRTGVQYLSNRTRRAETLAPGLYGLSNGPLDASWPKVERGKRALHATLANDATDVAEKLFEMLADRRIADEATLPRTGVSLEWERTLSAAFIAAPDYGTRSSTLLLIGNDDSVHFRERSFSPEGSLIGERRFEFAAGPGPG